MGQTAVHKQKKSQGEENKSRLRITVEAEGKEVQKQLVSRLRTNASDKKAPNNESILPKGLEFPPIQI